jgi:alpha-beta hydrolase superfamily lysophospholipase
MRRALTGLAVAAAVIWLAAPVLRAYQQVAPRPSEPARPSGLALEDVSFRSADGLLRGWLGRGRAGAPAVVLVHGYRGSREEMTPWAEFLLRAGYTVLLFDTRGCGQSEGRAVGLGATESRDISAAVAAAMKGGDTAKVAVLGISLGAGAAILAAASDPSIAAVVADSAWTDHDFMLDRLGTIRVGPFQIPLAPDGPLAVDAFVGTDVRAARPLEAIARVAPRPILLIHSADDDNATTPVAGAHALFAAAGAPKDLWIVPRGGHVGAINSEPDEYRVRVLAFLARALGTAPSR